jgi:translocation and assembly module TamB
MMSAGARALRIVGGALLALVLLVLLGFGLLQTSWGKAWLAGRLANALTSPGERVTISGLTGLVPIDMHIARIAFADAAGPRLVVSDAAIAIAPADLLSGKLTVRRLTAQSVDLARPSATTINFNLATLLHPPLAVRLEHVQIDRLMLGAAFLGEPVAATMTASLALGGGQASADLDLHRTDGKTAAIALHLALGGTPLSLSLAGKIEEPSGRLVADLLHRSEPLPLELQLAGNGALADWHGALTASAGSAARLSADFRITGNGGYHIAITGAADMARLLPPQLQPLAGGAQRFAAHAIVTDAEVSIENVTASIAAGNLSAKGHLARESGELLAEASLSLPDLARLSTVLGGTSRGALALSLALGGTLQNPVARLSATGDGVGFGDMAVAHAAATVDLHAPRDPFDAATPIDIAASGDAAGLSLGQRALPAALRQRIDWRIAGRIDRAREHVDLHELSVTDAGNDLHIAAGGGFAGFSGQAHLALPDLAQLTGDAAAGGLALDTDFRAQADGSATAVLSGSLRAPKTGTDALDRLLGDRAVISGTLRRAPDGALSVSDLRLEGAEARLEASGERSPGGMLAADLRLNLPRLAALAPDLGGSAALTAHLAGPPEKLSADVTLTAAALALRTTRLDHVQARLAVADLAHPSGRLSADFAGEGLSGTALLEGALEENETLHLTRIEIEAARTRLAGNLTLHLADDRMQGALAGTAPDLVPWSRLAGMPLAGSAQFKATLSADKGQNVDIVLDGKQIGLGGPSPVLAQRFHAATRLNDLLGTPSGRAELQLDAVRAGKVTLDALALKATSDRPGHFALEGNTHGAVRENFAVTLAAALTLERQNLSVVVSRLAGKLGDAPLALRRPLRLRRSTGEMALADLDLDVGNGHIGGSAKLAGNALALHLLGVNLPLRDLAAMGGVEQVTGSLGFELHLGGTRSAPEGELIADGEQLRFAAASRPDLPPLGLVAQASWHAGELRLKGRVAGPQNAALGFTGSVPLELDAQRLSLHLPPQRAVAFHLEGDGELGNLADTLPIGEDRLAGRFTIDVSVSGTVAVPEANGRLSLRNGRYESLATGTVLTGVNFDLVGNRDRLVLQNFAASDGAKGKLDLSGAVDLAAAGGPAFELAGRLASFRLLQLDQATAAVSGDMQLAGNIVAPRLGARLRIEHAELRVPERLPQNARPIAVTMIDSATDQVLTTSQQNAGSSPWLALQLDLVVDLPGQVFVRGRGLDSEWRGQLTVTGTTAAPVIAGKLEVVRGTYDFLGRTATLSSGRITFLGGKQINPEIAIEARATSNDIVAIVRITGTATQPRIQISSQPELPQDEILARLLFGTSISRISAAQGLELAQAAAALAGGGDPGILDRIRSGLGLDRLSLGSAANNSFSNIGVPSLSTPQGVPSAFPTAGIGASASPLGATTGPAGASAAAVTAGKYVANGVYVGVSQGIGAGSSSVDVQIDVTRHISIDTTAGGQTAGTGVGVNWKLDY